MRRWSARLALVLSVVVVLSGGGVPSGLSAPQGGSRFPLAGVFGWAEAAFAAWGYRDPVTPQQSRGGPVAGVHEVPVGTTRANGGNGRARTAGAGELAPFERVTVPEVGETTTAASHGFVAGRSRWRADLSSATNDVFENPDGSFTQRVHQAPVNYVGIDGVLRRIETRWSRGGGDGRWQVTGAPVSVRLGGAGSGIRGPLVGQPALASADSAGIDELVSVTLPGGYTVAYGMRDAVAVTPTVSGDKAVFAGVLPFTDVEIVTDGRGVKETIVLHSPQAGNVWVYPLDLGGLTAQLSEDGSMLLLDGAGERVGLIPAGFMQDSQLQPDGDLTTSDAVSYELITVEDGRTALKVTADRAWLDDPARVYPVTVDPTLRAFPTSGDVYIDTDSGTGSGSQNGTSIAVGQYGEWIGGDFVGQHKARGFLSAGNFDNAGLLGKRITDAKLKLYLTWTSDCSHHLPVDIYEVTSSWSVAALDTAGFPGPSLGVKMGSKTITDNYPACTNTGGDRSVGQWHTFDLDESVFNKWSVDGGWNYGVSLRASESNPWSWKRFTSGNYSGTSYDPYFELMYEDNPAPLVDALYPPSGYASPTLTPELVVAGSDEGNWPEPIEYKFFVVDPAGEPVVDSGGYSTSRSWTVPAGELSWGRDYVWTVIAFDGVYYTPTNARLAHVISTRVAQPPVTSGLSQNGGTGFNPSIGNYTTAATDAQLSTVGPTLSIERFYNSRDPRTSQAFGAGWSSLLDAKVAERTDKFGAVERVVITYPDGREVAFGKNPDGSFVPPLGRFATLRMVTSPEPGYELVDKRGTTYLFTAWTAGGDLGLRSVTDAQGRTLRLDYTSGRVTLLTAASGRHLHLVWTPDGQHVASVKTDPLVAGDWSTASEWTYTYSGSVLTKVCPPTSSTDCVSYSYGTNSLHPAAVLSAGPHSYLRLNDAAGSAGASNAAIDSLTVLSGGYHNVTLGQPGPLPGSAATAALFNGTDSYVELSGDQVALDAYYQSFSLWFKTSSTAGGVLLAMHNKPLPQDANKWQPALYVGTDGKLYGGLLTASASDMIASSGVVNDGLWHHVVLAAGAASQTMYVDGTAAGSLATPQRSHGDRLAYGYIGGGKWTYRPATSGDYSYFAGSIAEVALFDRQVDGDTVASLYATGAAESAPLAQITRASGQVGAQVVYDPASGRLDQVTDTNGGVWQVGAAQRSGSAAAYRSQVLGLGPADFWPLDDNGTAVADNEVNGQTLTYSSVTLGADGPFGDTTAAAFDRATQSHAVGSSPSIDTSQSYTVSAWVYMTEKAWNQQVLAVEGDRASPFYFGYTYNGDRWRMLVCESDMDSPPCPGVISTSVPQVNTWTHLAATVDASSKTVKLYVNGELEASATVPTLWKANGPLTLGRLKWRGGYADAWPGRLAGVATFQRALSADDIAAMFATYGGGGGTLVKTVGVSDPGGNTLSYVYDLEQGGRKLSRTDARGQTTVFSYDVGGFMHAVTDPNGNQTVTGHDVRGNVVSRSTCQDRSQQLCSTVYFTHFPDNETKELTPDPRNDVVQTVRDGRSANKDDNTYLTTYTYDSAGNRTGVTDPLGRTTTSAFTDGSTGVPAGLLTTVTLPNGATQTLTYTTAGDVESMTDAAGKRVEYAYDGLGRMITSTESTDSFPSGLTASYRYDKASRLVERTDPTVINRVTGAQHTARTTIVYDVDGRTISTTIADLTGGDAARAATRGYNVLGQLVWSQDPAGGRTEYTYDAYGNVATRTGPDLVTVAYTYDGEGHLLTTTVKGWTGDPSDPQPAQDLLTESRAYDPAGRLGQITDVMGWQNRYTYTDNNLVASITRHDPASGQSFVLESTSYDAAGHVIGQVTGDGVTEISSTVDAAGRVTARTVDPGGLDRTTSLTYGANDQVVSVQVADSSSVAARADRIYDQAGRMLSESVYTSDEPAPLGRWKLDGDTTDTAGNSTGTATNVTWSSERGGAAVFNGVDSSIEFAEPGIDTTASYSVSSWVKLVQKDRTQFAIIISGPVSSAFKVSYEPGADVWQVAGKGFDSAGAGDWWYLPSPQGLPAAGVWTHLVVTADAGTRKVTLYVDGVEQGAVTASKPFSNGAQVLRLGSTSNTATRWEGAIDDVQVYQEALTASEVADLHAGTLPEDGTVSRTSYTYDQRGLAVSATDPNGETSYVESDEAGRPAVTTSPSVTLEEFGQVPVSTVAVARTGYDTFGEPVEIVDAKGRQASFVYDAAGRQIEAHAPAYTPPGGSVALTPVVSTVYDSAGRVVKTIDAAGGQTVYTYDQLGRVASVTDPATGVSTFEYSLAGQQTAAVDASGARSEATWDYRGRQLTGTVVSRQAAQGFTTSIGYSTAGATSTVGVTSPDGVTSATTYDAAGAATTVVDGAGESTTYSYDAAGRRTSAVLPDGTSTGTVFDLAGRPRSQTSYDVASTPVRSQAWTYDQAGNVLAATDGRGYTTTFAYDALGRVISSTQPVTATESITTSVGYDASGAPTRFTDGRASQFWTTYNSLGLPEKQVEPATAAFPNEADRTYTSVYDVAGRLVREDKPGGVSVSHTYDSLGQLTKSAGTGAAVATPDRVFTYDPAGRTLSLTGSGGVNTLAWDDRGLLLSVAGPSGNSSFTYTGDGQMATRTDAAGTTSYGYDTAGRLASVSNPDTGVQAAYGYNQLSQVTQITYGSAGNRRMLGYDSLHRLTTDELKTPTAQTLGMITYGYDGNANIVSKTTTGMVGAAANTYTYDRANRLTSWSDGTTTTAYGYDKAGNRIQAGSATFTYDQRNRLVSNSTGTQYHYNAAGVLAGAVTGTVIRETHSDAFGQTVAQQYSDTGYTNYTYDGLGRAIQPGHTYTGLGNQLAADTDAAYTRTPGGRLLGVSGNSGADDRLVWTDRHTDVIAQFTATGTTLTGSAAYDPYGQPLASAGMVGNLGYQSEWTDPASGKVNMHARWYDPATGRFDSRDSVSLSPLPASVNANRYAYANANPLAYTDPTGHINKAPDESGSDPDYGVDPWAADWKVEPCKRSDAWKLAFNFTSGCGGSTNSGNDSTEQNAFNGRTGQTINGCPHGNYDWIFENCTGVGVYADGTVCINDLCLDQEALAGINPHTLAREVDWEVGERGGYGNNDKTALTAVVLNEAIQAAATHKQKLDAKIEEAKCNADFWCRNAGWIGTAAGIVAGAVAGAVCLAVTVGAGSIGCAILAGAVGGFVGSLTTGLLEGASITDASLWLDVGISTVVGGVIGGLTLGFGAPLAGALRGAAVGWVSNLGVGAMRSMAVSGARAGVRSLVGAGTGATGGSASGGLRAAITKATTRVKNMFGRGCKHSFDPGTPVLLATGATVAISEVEIGDEVLATDPETGETEATPVTKLHINDDRDLADVTIMDTDTGETSVLHTTWTHPFWSVTDDAWVEAKNLQPGDHLRDDEGKETQQVVAVKTWTGLQRMRDLTVADTHTYYVLAGNTPVLVHNCGFENNQPEEWVGELADMEGAGFKPAVQGTKEFDAIVGSDDPFLWVLRSDKTLAVAPQNFNGLRVTHSMLACGESVCGAGMGQSSFGALKLNNHSGHYWKDTPAWRAVTDVGRDAFRGLGFPVLARDLGLVR